MTLNISELIENYSKGALQPSDVIREVYRRIRAFGNDKNVWIHLLPEDEVISWAEALGPYRAELPLYGVPFAIKDNIDLTGVPTTAACPAFTYVASKSATVVDRLIAAGAIPIGKTNLDQFATGLVGTRSPYGACSSVFDPRYISGGSSSGSAVAVAADLVSFALGTDTAGSGRIPASFNELVGMKATVGALSTSGVVPACRTLDCVSIFARTCDEAKRVFESARSFDPSDSYSRRQGQLVAWPRDGFRFGVPDSSDLRFFGDESAPALFEKAAQHLESLGGTRVTFDFKIFRETAQLLYSGPWVAERLVSVREFAARHPEAFHPVTARIILSADSLAATATFEAIYRLSELTRAAEAEWTRMDFMLLPTAGNCYTHAEIENEPFVHNSDLGYYTNFVNLLDLAAVAVPAGRRASGMPFGVTVIAPAWSDSALLGVADRLHAFYAPSNHRAVAQPYCPEGYVPLAVCGAHLAGQPLNYQLINAGAFLIESTRTAPSYKFYALRGTVPPKPGLVFTAEGGASIAVEVWAVPEDKFGPFVAAVPPPLAIGNCLLESCRRVKSFVCEPWALADAEDITHLADWRAYVSRS